MKYRADAEVAARNKAVAEAKHFRFVQSATVNSKDLAEVAITRAELDVATAELAYANELLARAEIRAERSGLLIYSAKSDWLGKPVAVGERLMEIGDPQRTEIRIDLAVADAIALKAGGKVTLFLDGDPMRAVKGTIVQTSYRPLLTGDQQLAFRIRAEFDDAQPRRIGLRGTARVSGDHASLWLYLLRRSISSLRQRFGL